MTAKQDIRAREDLPLEGFKPMLVRCDAHACDRAAIMNPARLFGGRRHWPAAGASDRFRCACGGRRARISYPARMVEVEGSVHPAALALWF